MFCEWSSCFVYRWTEKFIGWQLTMWCNIWSNLTKRGLFFNIISLVVNTLLPSVLQRLDSHGIEALILILEKVLNCRMTSSVCTASKPSVFSCWWTENSQMVPNQENMEGDQPVQRNSHARQPLQAQTVCRSIVLVKQDSLHQFSRPFCNASIVAYSAHLINGTVGEHEFYPN